MFLFLFIYRSEYNFFRPRHIVRQKPCYVGQGEFQTGPHRTTFFNKKKKKKKRTSRVCMALKTILSYYTFINIHDYPIGPQ